MKNLILLFVLGLGPIQLLAAAEPVLGVPPQALLAVLPQTPEGGKLTKSIGHNEVSPFPALLTIAIRDYREEPPAVISNELPPPPRLTKVTLLDTALDPDRAFVFDVFRSDAKADSNNKRFTREGTTVIEQLQGNSRRRLLIPLENRFLLSLVLENQNDQDRDRWLDRLDLPRLINWARKAPKLPPPPHKFTVVHVDELDSKRTHTTSIPYLSPAEAQAQINREKEEDRKYTEQMRKILPSTND